MTRRKKPPPQRKLQQVTDSSGWTHVVKGPPGIINPRTTGVRLERGKSSETKYTLETYLVKFREHYAPIWRESTCFKSLSRILEQAILPAENIIVTQCICLGLGSMTAGPESSSYELAALISILEILGIDARMQNAVTPQANPDPQARNTTFTKPSSKTPSSTRSTTPFSNPLATPSSNHQPPFPNSTAPRFSSRPTSNVSITLPPWTLQRQCCPWAPICRCMLKGKRFPMPRTLVSFRSIRNVGLTVYLVCCRLSRRARRKGRVRSSRTSWRRLNQGQCPTLIERLGASPYACIG